MRLPKDRIPKEIIEAVRAKGLIAGDEPQPKAVPQLPKGRPKNNETWAELIQDELSKIEDIDGTTYKRKLIRKVVKLADAGVEWAIKWLADREEGKAKQQVDLDAKGGGAVSVTVVKFGDLPKKEEGPEA